MKCMNCGTDNRPGVSTCIACGTELTVSQFAAPQAPVTSSKNKLTAGLLALFLGGIGVHKFYLNAPGGIWYLLFFWTGIPAILALIDAIVLLSMSDQEFASKYP